MERKYETDFQNGGNCNRDRRGCGVIFTWLVEAGRRIAIDRQGRGADAGLCQGYPYRGGYARNEGVSWYAVRAYYWGGPWSGPGYSYAGWYDYATQYGIGCVPGSIVKGGDGIDYLCQ